MITLLLVCTLTVALTSLYYNIDTTTNETHPPYQSEVYSAFPDNFNGLLRQLGLDNDTLSEEARLLLKQLYISHKNLLLENAHLEDLLSYKSISHDNLVELANKLQASIAVIHKEIRQLLKDQQLHPAVRSVFDDPMEFEIFNDIFDRWYHDAELLLYICIS